MQNDLPGETLKSILVIGCGSIGERHLRCFLKTERVKVSACDSNPSLLSHISQAYGVAAYGDLVTALASDSFDAAVICTPAQSHLSVARLCLEKNMHLLIEKPLSTTLEGTDWLAGAVRNAGVYAAVAYVYHSIPCVVKAKEYLHHGSLGKPLQVTVTAGQHFPDFRPQYQTIYYNDRATGGGAIQDALTHHFNCVEWLIGQPTTRIFCDAAHLALEGVNVEDTVAATARNGETVVSYALNQFQRPNETIITIHCANGSVKIELHNHRWMVLSEGAANWQIYDEPLSDRDDMFVTQANAFLDGCEGMDSNLCTIEEAIHTLKVNLAAIRSADTGLAVEIL